MKYIIFSKKAKFFYILNFILVSLPIILLISFHDGEDKDILFDFFAASIMVAALIILFQYPILNYKKNWFYKTLIFYISMIVFLFIFGIMLFWRFEVDKHITDRLFFLIKDGVLVIIAGQLFGGLICFIPILITNFILRKRLFLK